jgi:hypothetical protein
MKLYSPRKIDAKSSIKLLSKVFSIYIIYQVLLTSSIKCHNPCMFYSTYNTFEKCLQDISWKIYGERTIELASLLCLLCCSLANSKVPIRDRFRERSRTKVGPLVLQFWGWARGQHPQLTKTRLCLMSGNEEGTVQKSFKRHKR